MERWNEIAIVAIGATMYNVAPVWSGEAGDSGSVLAGLALAPGSWFDTTYALFTDNLLASLVDGEPTHQLTAFDPPVRVRLATGHVLERPVALNTRTLWHPNGSGSVPWQVAEVEVCASPFSAASQALVRLSLLRDGDMPLHVGESAPPMSTEKLLELLDQAIQNRFGPPPEAEEHADDLNAMARPWNAALMRNPGRDALRFVLAQQSSADHLPPGEPLSSDEATLLKDQEGKPLAPTLGEQIATATFAAPIWDG